MRLSIQPRYFATLAAFLLTPAIVFAQSSTRLIVDQPVQWNAISSNVKLSPRTTLFLDAQLRFVAAPDNFKAAEPMQHQLRVHLDFVLKGKLTFAPLGYVNVWNYV